MNLVPSLRDLLHLVPRLDLEEEAPAVGLPQDRLGAHAHAGGRGGQVTHVHPGAHGGRAGRQVRGHHRVSRVLEQVDHERSGEDRDAGIPEGVGGELA